MDETLRTLLASLALSSLVALGGQQGMIPVIDTKPATTAAAAISQWPMNEGSGSNWFDASGNGNNLAITPSQGTWGTNAGFPGSSFTTGGATATAGPTPGAWQLDGTTPFSICTWINPSTSPGEEAIIGTISGTSGPFTGYALERVSTNFRFVLVHDVSVANWIYVDTNAGFAAGSKYQVCATYNGSANASGVIIYVNGSSTTTTTGANALVGSTATNGVGIGGRIGAGGVNFVGVIQFTSIWPCALSSGVISTNNTAGPSFTGLHC